MNRTFKPIRKNFPETPPTLDQAVKLLALKGWPEDREHWKPGIFLDGLNSIIRRAGATRVRFQRESILEELERIMIF